MGGGWHLPYGGTLAGLSDPAEGELRWEALGPQFCCMYPVLPYAMLAARTQAILQRLGSRNAD